MRPGMESLEDLQVQEKRSRKEFRKVLILQIDENFDNVPIIIIIIHKIILCVRK